jgi:hypothetical protein
MANAVDSTKTPSRPSHEPVESTGGNASGIEETEEQRLDQVAMEGAKRAEKRIRDDEPDIPGSSIFTK